MKKGIGRGPEVESAVRTTRDEPGVKTSKKLSAFAEVQTSTWTKQTAWQDTNRTLLVLAEHIKRISYPVERVSYAVQITLKRCLKKKAIVQRQKDRGGNHGIVPIELGGFLCNVVSNLGSPWCETSCDAPRQGERLPHSPSFHTHSI